MHAHGFRLLDMIHTILVRAAATGSITSLFKKIATINQRKMKIMHTREELLNLLRNFEVRVYQMPLHSLYQYAHINNSFLRETTRWIYYPLSTLHSTTTISMVTSMRQSNIYCTFQARCSMKVAQVVPPRLVPPIPCHSRIILVRHAPM